MRGTRWMGLVGAPLFVFLLLPVLALAFKGVPSLQSTLQSDDARTALGVSLKTTTVSLLLLLITGTPLGAYLAGRRTWATRLTESVVQLPLVLPPAAAGIALLLAFGRHGFVPTSMPFTAAAVVAAQCFMAAPIYVQSATSAFQAVSGSVLDLAETEGASAFQALTRVAAPIAAPALLGGALMAWARMLGEFGATILFAGNLAGRTQTLPLAIYLGFESDLDQAVGLSFLLLLVAAVVLGLARLLSRR